MKNLEDKKIYDVFIAHVEEDADIALEIAVILEQAGYTTWTYEIDSIPGPSYLVQTGQAVESSKAFVVLISPHSLGSKQLTKEVVRAHEAGKEFIPVRRDVSHVEFQTRQPEWREAVGAASSISVTTDGVEVVANRIIDGLKALGIHPKPKADTARIGQIRKILDKIRESGTTGEAAGPTRKYEEAAAREVPSAKPGRPRKFIKFGGIAAAAVVVIAVVVVLFTVVLAKCELITSVSPDGGGTVAPTGGNFNDGTEVTLTAVPAQGYAFDSWSGDVTDKSSSIKLTMDGDKSVVAHFKIQYTLSAAASPDGGGIITPVGGSYDDGAEVTLVAVPAQGYAFDGWSGDVTGKTSPVTLAMNGDKSVVAHFKIQYTLNASVGPDGGGTVTPVSGSYDDGSEVTLAAVPTQGYAFDRWSGDVTGKTSPVTLAMNGNKSVVAHFKIQYTLSAAASPDGGGTVTPVGGSYDNGAEVTLAAVPAQGYAFDRWSGDITGKTSPFTLAMNGNKSVVAHFNKIFLEDQFTDNRNEWYVDEQNYIANGVYNTLIVEKDPDVTATRKNFKWPDDSPGFARFGFEADVITIQSEDSMGRGIVFLCDPAKPAESDRPQREYMFLITGGGEYKLAYEIDHDFINIIPWTTSPFLNTGRATNRLKVICRDTNIEIYANDHLLATAKGEFPTVIGDNGIGVLTCGNDGTHIAFDNIRMWEISD
jgi:uncharacterized repeat protein (TIGR02543 family)